MALLHTLHYLRLKIWANCIIYGDKVVQMVISINIPTRDFVQNHGLWTSLKKVMSFRQVPTGQFVRVWQAKSKQDVEEFTNSKLWVMSFKATVVMSEEQRLQRES